MIKTIATLVPLLFFCAVDTDPIANELAIAKELMRKALSDNELKVKAWFESEDTRARNLTVGAFEKVNEIKKEYASYKELKVLPKRAPKELKDADKKAVLAAISAYRKAIAAYTKIKNDSLAESYNDEMKLLVKTLNASINNGLVLPTVTSENCRSVQLDASKNLGLPISKTIEIDMGVKMAFVLIPAGKALIGSPANEMKRDPSEVQHEIEINKAFYIGKFEINQNQWSSIMKSNPSKYKGPLLPVDNISYADLVEFVSKINGKGNFKFGIPGEIEWEYSCRAGSVTPFSFGNQFNGIQSNSDGREPYGTSIKGPNAGRPLPVGKYPPNPWGTHDMHGNVWEWCRPNEIPMTDVKSDRIAVAQRGKIFRLCGGSWLVKPELCRSSFRGGPYEADLGSHDFGARLVMFIE